MTRCGSGGASGAARDFGPKQLADFVGGCSWEISRGRELRLVPEPDVGGKRWSEGAAEGIRGRWGEIVAAIEAARELGAVRCAALLAERTGLGVDAADVEVLRERGVVAITGYYKEWPLYRVVDVIAAVSSPEGAEVLATVVAERKAWLAASVSRGEAAVRLGWSGAEFDQVVKERALRVGRFWRYALADVEALAADEELGERVRGNRLLGPEEAAMCLEIRRVDFDYCVAAGWIAPAGYGESRVSRRRTVDVALYRVRDVEAVLEVPGVDWEAVRGVKPGEPSPLREYATLPTSRGVLVRGFAADLGARYGVEVSASYDEDKDRWKLRWSPNGEGEPRRAAVRSAIRRDGALAPHSEAIVLAVASPADGAAPEAKEGAR